MTGTATAVVDCSRIRRVPVASPLAVLPTTAVSWFASAVLPASVPSPNQRYAAWVTAGTGP